MIGILVSAAMSDERKISCDDCYFRRLGLCAIPGNNPCPTFRPMRAMEEPPREPRAVAQPPPRVRVVAAA
jgi:hypothetical protein